MFGFLKGLIMRMGRLIPLLLIGALTTAIPSRNVQAAPAPSSTGTRVAIANPSRIFSEMAETKALRENLEAKRKELGATELDKRKAIDAMIQDRDTNYNPKHPKYQEICEQIDKAKADFQAWGTTQKATADRQQKLMLKNLYDKIEAAVSQVALQDGIDLVIADGRQEVSSIEDVPPEDLRRLLNGRVVLFSSKSVDISEKVILVLNQQFSKNVAQVPPATPAPVSPTK